MEKRERRAEIIHDTEGNSIVMINDILFKGKRSVNWDDVKEYLMQYVGEVFTIEETEDAVYIGADLPDEYSGSVYTRSLRGAAAKAKANAAQGIPELLNIAVNGSYIENKKEKHAVDAANGWYRYEARFALPVYSETGEIERYNVFHVFLIIRHDRNGKKYLYDLINIKKETSNPPGY